MNFNIISGGVLVNFFMNMATVFFLIHYKFEITEQNFTFILLVNVAIVSLVCGIFSKRFSHINGFFTGLLSACILVLFLAQFVRLNWELNGILIALWGFTGLLAAFVGHKIFRGSKKNVEKIIAAKSQK